MGMDLEQAFSNTSKILFGEEIGKLSDFRDYLGEMMSPYQVRRSVISGKEVVVSSPYCPDDAKFISQDEIGQVKLPPLNVNEIKDIDSLFSAVQERIIYCGNRVFGTNVNVSNVDNSTNCSFVSNAHKIYNVKYGAYLSYLRESEYVFGVWGFPKSKFSMRVCEGVGANRCFESYYGTNLSETYYVFNCIGCQNAMFSFNLRSKRNVIGNLELPKDQFLALKEKLIAEMADELKRKKRLFSITELAFHGRDRESVPGDRVAYDSPPPKKVEEAFKATTRLVLGRERPGIKNYGKWLLRNAMKVKKVKGALGSPTYKIEDFPVVREIPADRLVTLDEGLELAKKKQIRIDKNETLTLKEVLDRVSKIAFFSVEFVDGQNENCIDTPSIFTGSNVYKVWDVTNGKNSAYSTGVVESEHIFGGSLQILQSQFCINCYDPVNIRGCFEVEGAYTSRDSYFCHNVENVENCIFCFNAKSLRYAVGNTEVGKPEFERIKKILLDYINRELDGKRELEASIFAIPKGKKR